MKKVEANTGKQIYRCIEERLEANSGNLVHKYK